MLEGTKASARCAEQRSNTETPAVTRIPSQYLRLSKGDNAKAAVALEHWGMPQSDSQPAVFTSVLARHRTFYPLAATKRAFHALVCTAVYGTAARH